MKFSIPNQPPKQEKTNVITTPAVNKNPTSSVSVGAGFSLQKRVPENRPNQPTPVSPAQILQEVASKTGAQATPQPAQEATAQQVVLASGPAYTTQPDLLGPGTADQFKANLTLLLENVSQPQMLAHVIRRIMADLQQHPELREFLAPEHGGAMVRMLRESYGVQVEAKQAKSRKKKTDSGPGMDIGDLSSMLVDLT